MTTCNEKFGHLKDLILRRFESPEQKRKWKDYEHVLSYRTMAAEISRIMIFFLNYPFGTTLSHASAAYLEEGGPENFELA